MLVYIPTLLLLLLLPLDLVALAHSSYRGVPWGIRFVYRWDGPCLLLKLR